jgi:putative addiction module killer protein
LKNIIDVREHPKYAKWWDKMTDKAAKGRIDARLKRLREKGFFGDCVYLGNDVWELRIHYGPGYRVYFTRQGLTLIMLLCGGDKSSQSEDITLAKRLAKEVLYEGLE